MPPSASTYPGALLLLAAGASRRMGTPKQLLPVGGQTLVRRVVGGFVPNLCARLVVVVGSHGPAVRTALEGLKVTLVDNPEWGEGLGASIRVGLGAIMTEGVDLPWVVVGLGDQPDFTPNHLRLLVDEHRTSQRGIVATRCAGVVMPPILFAAKYFAELSRAHGDVGARSVVASHPQDMAAIDVPDWLDLDTPADVERFRQRRD